MVRAAKQQLMRTELAGEIERLVLDLARVCERHRRHRDHTRAQLRDALIEFMTGFSVYRTYVAPARPTSVADRAVVADALARAREARPDIDDELLQFLAELLLLEHSGAQETELALRFAQVSAPVMAKGVEDTAFYRFQRLIALNEVGGDPGVFGRPVADFHAWCAMIARRHPRTMLTLSTHDTKRSADARARILALAEIPAEFSAAALRWAKHNAVHRTEPWPDRDTEYLLYQTLVGTWPISPARVGEFMLKAVREAKVHTSWVRPDHDYEAALERFCAAVLADEAFRDELEDFLVGNGILAAGRTVSLAQTTLLLTCPGVPDIYQGDELWNLVTVDPDNRRPVDFTLREQLLRRARGLDAAGAADHLADGGAKLWLTARLLELRRERPEIFDSADLPGHRRHRRARPPTWSRSPAVSSSWWCPDWSSGLAGDWADTTGWSCRAGEWRDVLSGQSHTSRGGPGCATAVAIPGGRAGPAARMMPASYAVWAPGAEAVDLCLDGARIPMQRRADGWWSGGPPPRPGDRYGFGLDGGPPRADPRSGSQPDGPEGLSAVLDHGSFSWHDGDWRGFELPGSVLYELHVGTFSPEGTFDGVVERLDHLVALGVDAIEVMPIAQFPGRRGWGYDGVNLYAAHHGYGGPDGFKRLVDACHRAGLAVILDVVYNHLGPAGNYLSEFGPYFPDRYTTGWGAAVNFDGPDSDEVRRWVIDNALMWLRDYHVDGLRLDAVRRDPRPQRPPPAGAAGRRGGAALGPARPPADGDRRVRPQRPPLRAPGVLRRDGFGRALVRRLAPRGARSVDRRDRRPLRRLRRPEAAHRRTVRRLGLRRSLLEIPPARARPQPTPTDGPSVHRVRAEPRPGRQPGAGRTDRSAGPGGSGSRGRRAAADHTVHADAVPGRGMGRGDAVPVLHRPFRGEAGRSDPRRAPRRVRRVGQRPGGSARPAGSGRPSRRSCLDWSELSTQPEHAEMLAWYTRLIALRRTHPDLGSGKAAVTADFDAATGLLRVDRGQCLVLVNLGRREVAVLEPTGCEVLLASDPTPRRDGRTMSLPPNAVVIRSPASRPPHAGAAPGRGRCARAGGRRRVSAGTPPPEPVG